MLVLNGFGALTVPLASGRGRVRLILHGNVLRSVRIPGRHDALPGISSIARDGAATPECVRLFLDHHGCGWVG